MGKFVAGCVVLFVLALAVVILTAGSDLAALFGALRAEPLSAKLAWTILVLVPLVMLPAAVWLSDSLMRQRQAATALELRLAGVRQGVKDVAASQIDAEAALHHLARTDPEQAIGAMQQRLGEAERVLTVQAQRNALGDLQSRVDEVRTQQQNLRQRLAPVLEQRQSVERLFVALDTAQLDIERALAEIAGGEDGTALDLRLKNLMEAVRLWHGRCDDIERAAKTIADLKDAYADLQARLVPYAAAAGGITQRVNDLSRARDTLAAGIEALQRTPEGTLAERVQKFADERTRLDDGVAHLTLQFSRLAALRDDIEAVAAKFEAALNIVPLDTGAAAADARIEELTAVIDTTQDQIEDIEDRMAAFAQLKTRLDALQERIIPLEASDGGVVSLVDQVQAVRDKLAVKVARLEAGDSGDLAARVQSFTAARRELEARVATVSEHFSALATVRKDLAGLLEKLSSAASASSN